MIDLFIKGGPLIIPLLVLSVLSVAVIFEREIFFLRNNVPDSLLRDIKMKVLSGRKDEAQAISKSSNRVILRFLTSVFENYEETSDIAEKEIAIEGDKLLYAASKHIHIQELIGSIAPLIGLSGTVVGLVQAFREVGLNTSAQIAPQLLAGGIWVAMLTTVAGLFTAIPSLIFAHINRTRVKKLAFNMKIYGEEINTLLRKTT
jgi:biopolymer transport protein ExbB